MLLLRRGAPPPYTARLCLVPEPLAPGAVREAWRAVLCHHDGLRSRFTRRGGAWSAHIASAPAEVPLAWIDLSPLRDDDIAALLDRLPDFTALFDLENGPLLYLLVFHGGPGRPDALLPVVHHLVTDGLSNRVIEEDLTLACRQLSRGEPVWLPAKTTSVQSWGRRLREWAARDEILAELPWWLTAERRAAQPLPEDLPEGDDTWRSSRCLVQRLPRSMTAGLLGPLPRRLAARIDEVVLIVLQTALGEWAGSRSVLADFVAHGRNPPFADIDLLRTVGWMSITWPLLLDLPAAPTDPLHGLRYLQTALREVPSSGFGFSLLQMRDDPEITAALSGLPPSALEINLFLDEGPHSAPGAKGGPNDGAPELSERPAETMAEADRDRPRRHQLVLYASVQEGELEIEWWYSAGRYHTATIRRLAEMFHGAAERLLLQSTLTP